ncbi:hypothetical protein MU852_08920 [Brevundimonas albigilva]|uniref:hypothetical protein n=1 Tax=Brevundimonas albigilva TaxID=1312364 RepID=UPI00201B6275|nr:hypothetical protein [Brevundimonas albigilva]UQV17111.1 hypothetical protein MU852_08920 [Brevundimonas albigilva]
MKTINLLAGVAAVAMITTAGSASAEVINRGQWINNYTVGGVVVPGLLHRDAPSLLGGSSSANWNRATDGSASESAWHAVGASVNDIGDAKGSDGATFTLEGTVSTDCAYYSGNNNTETFDFGQLGIYAGDETGPAAAFTMVAPAVLSIQTNLAGCNTNNSVTLSRTSVDLQNGNSSGFNQDVFQDTLPYSVTARYTGSAYNTGNGGAGIPRQLVLAAGAVNPATENNGAWKSPMSLDVLIPVTAKALLAGEYTGQFTLEIKAI